MKGKDRQRVCKKDTEITDRQREKKNIGRRNETVIIINKILKMIRVEGRLCPVVSFFSQLHPSLTFHPLSAD